MARPVKRGLDYFPFDTDFFDDVKIMDLTDRYGPLGLTVYIAALCVIYREGYYAELSEARLAQVITRMIGYRWMKSQNNVINIIRYCCDIGLFDAELMCKGYATSASIQKRYESVKARSKIDKSKFWLLQQNVTET